MTNSKTTKRALFSSVVALLLCFTMLLGTTFAWFTDSAASGSNVITAGNLDIVVEYTLDGENWDNLDGADDLFQKGLWEPGHTEVVALRIKNNGTLALKYVANMNIVKEEKGLTKDDKDIVLSEILTVSTLVQQAVDADGNANQIGDITLGMAFNGENSIAYENTATFKAGNVLRNDVMLQPGAAHYLIVKVDMAETVGNEANHDGTHVPTINFGINVLATQYTYENDSFGKDYDEGAEYPVIGTPVSTAAELKAAFAKGGTIVLQNNIAFEETIVMPEGNDVILNMNGKTITVAEDAECDPLIDMKTGSSLVIDGNGTFDLGEKYSYSLMYPRGDVTIKNGTFLRAAGGETGDYGSYFVGINGGKGKLIIEDGYFDGGCYTAGDCFNNSITLLNCSWGQYIRVYGGTFVGQNPAWGDEGMADICPHCTSTYCQGIFLEGQTKESTELPDGYTITEGTTADGRPTYTVNYSK